MSRIRKGTIAGALAVAVVGGAEGLRTHAYHDAIGVVTACYGETRGIRMGMTFTKEQCNDMLVARLNEFATKVEKCVKRPMSDRVEVAFTSLAYNIGEGGFCKSSVVRLWNAGEKRAACDAMMRFNRAGGRVLSGLTSRRKKERALCLQGIAA